VPQPIRFMAKVSLFKIPFFGWALARAGFIPIDRKNRRTAVKSFDLAAQRIRKGNTIVVFPEEGRSRNREMKAFQRGGFLLALKSGLPVLPLALDGTYDIFRVGAKRVTPGVVTIRVGTPIETEGMSVRNKEKLAVESRAQIHRMLFGRDEELPPQGNETEREPTLSTPDESNEV
jgi:1-acyl-sn-glycerol-3-phosphate acyltransferase